MSFETISLLLNWLEMGVMLAILFRLGHTFELIATTQHELRRAIHHLGESRAAEWRIADDSSKPVITQHARVDYGSTIGTDDLAGTSPGLSP